MYARHVALHLKPNTLSDFTKTFDTECASHPAEAKGIPGRNHICDPRWDRT